MTKTISTSSFLLKKSTVWKLPSIKVSMALFILIPLLVCMLCGAWLAPHDPTMVNLSQKFLPISSEHWLGTDHLGRDILSRLMVGAQYSLFTVCAILTVLVCSATILGALCATLGGFFDTVIMRICDGMMVFPTIVLALFLIGILGTGLSNLVLAISITHLAWYTRLVRSYVLTLKSRDYVLAAQSMNVGRMRIILRHYVPAIVGQICIVATLDVGHMLLHVAGLSFLGLGIQPPTPEWGVMISEARNYLRTQPWIIMYPGIMVFLATAAANLLGDSLRDALDPSLQEEGV